jgi:four helix bundle protein
MKSEESASPEERRMKNLLAPTMINFRREGGPLHQKSYAFAIRIVNMFLHFTDNDWKLQTIYKQVLRSGTSISANVHESEFAQSPADFSSKLHIALKEANETMNWLNLLHDTNILDEKGFESMAYDCNEIIALLVSSIKTVKKNNQLK